MFAKYLALVAGIVGAVIVFAPRDRDTLTQGVASDPQELSTNTLVTNSQANADWNAGGHSLPREADGHFYADTIVDGAAVRMVVDTGASVIALTASDASAAGLYWDESEVVPIGSGASGTVYGVPAKLSEVEVGGIVERNIQAVIIPEGLEISLLGQSWLSRLDAVEIANDEMVLNAN